MTVWSVTVVGPKFVEIQSSRFNYGYHGKNSVDDAFKCYSASTNLLHLLRFFFSSAMAKACLSVTTPTRHLDFK
jgi:hypothetical protein